MKLNKLLFVCLSAFVIAFTSCKSDNPVTGITLDEASLSIAVDETATLTATILPKGADGTITWASQDATIATVDNGVVTGVKAGATTVVASCGSFSASCSVTVTATSGGTGDASLEGSDYYLIYMDEASATKISDKIVADFRPDDVTKFLYVWDATYVAGSSTGPNSYGEVTDWLSFVVQSVGWSGLGFNCADLSELDKLATVTDNPDGYYFHIAIKTQQSGKSHRFYMNGTGDANGGFVLGSSSFVDGNNTYSPYADITTDGEWNYFDIPMSVLVNEGLKYRTGNDKALNVFCVLSGAVAGTTLDMDAIFIYKK